MDIFELTGELLCEDMPRLFVEKIPKTIFDDIPKTIFDDIPDTVDNNHCDTCIFFDMNTNSCIDKIKQWLGQESED